MPSAIVGNYASELSGERVMRALDPLERNGRLTSLGVFIIKELLLLMSNCSVLGERCAFSELIYFIILELTSF